MFTSHLCRIASLMLLCGIVFSLGCNGLKQAPQQKIIGATATIHIAETNIDFLARIDTGARTTSLHALNIMIEGEAATKEENVGKQISFDVFDATGKAKRLTTIIAGVTKVRNAQGVEYRYKVPMTLIWDGDRRALLVNLRDRSAMTYPLLIGRDYLSGDILVDIDKDTGK